VLDADGALALGKFPSITDTRSIVRGEVLALKLARLVGLDAAEPRIEMIDGTAVAIIRRFDRTRMPPASLTSRAAPCCRPGAMKIVPTPRLPTYCVE
jgi:hypothetical protein